MESTTARRTVERRAALRIGRVMPDMTPPG
jgi:hypothetical protein